MIWWQRQRDGKEGGKAEAAVPVLRKRKLAACHTFHAKPPESHPTPSSGITIAAQSSAPDLAFHGARGHSQSQALIFY